MIACAALGGCRRVRYGKGCGTRCAPVLGSLTLECSMRLSRLFGKTLRRPPAEAESANHQLLLRAGLVQQTAAGIYSFLPLGYRALRRIEQIVREEMDAAGGQELHLPVLSPAELWEESGRLAEMGGILMTLQDRRERTLVLGPTHEEVITDLVRRHVQSYRDLPQRLYQIQTKFRDEARPRGGLLRGREFVMKDLYSFDPDWAGATRRCWRPTRRSSRAAACRPCPCWPTRARSAARSRRSFSISARPARTRR